MSRSKAVNDYETAGQQTVLPGAERISQGEQARRLAAAPLRPKVNQRPCDAGLFSDDANQLDLCEMCKDSTEDGL